VWVVVEVSEYCVNRVSIGYKRKRKKNPLAILKIFEKKTYYTPCLLPCLLPCLEGYSWRWLRSGVLLVCVDHLHICAVSRSRYNPPGYDLHGRDTLVRPLVSVQFPMPHTLDPPCCTSNTSHPTTSDHVRTTTASLQQRPTVISRWDTFVRRVGVMPPPVGPFDRHMLIEQPKDSEHSSGPTIMSLHCYRRERAEASERARAR
jgi:hypothetical protein